MLNKRFGAVLAIVTILAETFADRSFQNRANLKPGS